MNLTCVIYCRISKDPEGNELGVERQEADCRALAARLGLKVSRVFVDNDISASTLSRKPRKQYEEMMALVEAGQVGTILAYSNSRLTRRLMEMERLIAAHDRTGVRFRTVVSGDDDLSTADGRMTARIKASVDAAQSERMGELIRRQKEQAVEMGKYLGGWRSYGFEADGRTMRETEAVERVKMSAAILNGTSLTSLARKLNEREVPTSTGKAWTTRSLKRVLMRPHPAVDAGVHEAVCALLGDPERNVSPGPGRRWLLSGIARCEVCGDWLRGTGSSSGSGKGTYPAYRCRTGKHVVINAEILDGYIGAVVVERMRRPDAARAFTVRSADTTAASTRSKVLRTRLDALADNIEIDERTLARRSRALRAELDTVQQQIADAARTTVLGAFAGRDPGVVWEGLDLDGRRAVVGILMTVTVTRTTRGVVPLERRWLAELPSFDPERVQIVWRENPV